MQNLWLHLKSPTILTIHVKIYTPDLLRKKLLLSFEFSLSFSGGSGGLCKDSVWFSN